MAGPRSDQHDKTRLWGSLRRRLSASNWKKIKETNSSSNQNRSLQDGRPTCLDRQLQSTRTVALHSFLCLAPQQRFAPLDDDTTFSIRPLIGLSAQYHQRYTDLWLADNSESSRKMESPAQFKFDADPSEKSNATNSVEEPTTCSIGGEPETFMQAPPQNTLENEITRLEMTLNKATVFNPPHRPVRISHHVSEYDVDVKSTTTATSHPSIADNSEFSFQADFSKMAERAVHQAPASVEKIVPFTDAYAPTTNIKAGVRVSNEAISAGNESNASFKTMGDRMWNQHNDRERTDGNVSQPGRDRHQIENRHGTVAGLKSGHERKLNPKLYRSIFMESDYPQGLICDEESFLNPLNSLKANDCDSRYPLSQMRCSHQLTTNNCVENTDTSLFRGNEHSGDCERHLEEPNMLLDDEVKNDIHINGFCYNRSDQSRLASETTRSALFGEVLHNIKQEQVCFSHRGEPAVRRAKCVVVYDKQLGKNNAPGRNARQMVVRMEAVKRMSDYAVEFGYKDFLPIHDQQS